MPDALGLTCENLLFQLSHKQVQKMNQVTMEKDQDLTTLKKKLEGMVKLNQALTNERSELMNKIKDMVIIASQIHNVWLHFMHTSKPDEFYIFRKPMKYLQTIEGYHSSNYEFNPGRASARRLDIGHKLRCYINKFSRTYEPRRDYFHLKFGSLSNEGRDCLYQDQVISEQMIIRQGSCKILCFIIPPLPDNCQVDEGQGTLRMKINLDYEQLQTDTAM